MQESSPQNPNPKASAGYRPLISADLTRGVGPAAYGYVAAAAGLGLALGVTFAVMASHGRVAAASSVAPTLKSPAYGLATLPASFTVSAPTLLRQVEPQRRQPEPSSLLSRVSEKSSTKHAGAHKKHGIHKLLNWRKSSRERKAIKRRPYVSPNPPAPEPDQPTALQMATAAAANGPFFLGIQGDFTVANYDETTGTIQTYEGETYLLAKAGAENGAIPWQSYPFNVHYRCDEIGNCTLSHAGASAIAKLTR